MGRVEEYECIVFGEIKVVKNIVKGNFFVVVVVLCSMEFMKFYIFVENIKLIMLEVVNYLK